MLYLCARYSNYINNMYGGQVYVAMLPSHYKAIFLPDSISINQNLTKLFRKIKILFLKLRFAFIGQLTCLTK